MKKVLGFGALALFLLLVDICTKAFAYNYLPLTNEGIYEVPIFRHFLGVDFSLTLALNKGAAWGIFADFQGAIVALRLGVIAALIGYLFFSPKARALPLVLIITGALGNVLDYFIYGSVVDFLRFNLWGYPFPIFNCADTLITLGVLTFFLSPFSRKLCTLKKGE